jgi:hypothetical protein
MRPRSGFCWQTLIVFCFLAGELVTRASQPDLSGLASEDRTSIEAACLTAKYLDGPAAYHDCLQKQLGTVSGSRAADLSGLKSEDRTSRAITTQPTVPMPTPTTSGAGLCAENGSCYGDPNV